MHFRKYNAGYNVPWVLIQNCNHVSNTGKNIYAEKLKKRQWLHVNSLDILTMWFISLSGIMANFIDQYGIQIHGKLYNISLYRGIVMRSAQVPFASSLTGNFLHVGVSLHPYSLFLQWHCCLSNTLCTAESGVISSILSPPSLWHSSNDSSSPGSWGSGQVIEWLEPNLFRKQTLHALKSNRYW